MKIYVATTTESFWRPQAEGIAQAMRELGCNADVVTPRTLPTALGRQCDVLFCLGSGESPRPFLSAIPSRAKVLYLIESIPTPTESDDFTRFKLDVHRSTLVEFDHVFVHTRRSIPVLESLGVKRLEPLVWPHFPSIYQPASYLWPDIDVLFFGTLSPYRRRILEKVAARFHLTYGSGVFHQQSGLLYARAKIALNIHFTPLRNFECRVSEALGCRAFLLTQALDPEDVLIDGCHLAVFDEDNLLDRIDYFLRRPEKRTEIAQGGHAEIQKYCVEHQVKRVVEVSRQLT